LRHLIARKQRGTWVASHAPECTELHHGGFGNSLLGPIDALFGLEMSNFERERMLKYLGNPPEPNSLGNRFKCELAHT
jgi:hypothetical protein